MIYHIPYAGIVLFYADDGIIAAVPGIIRNAPQRIRRLQEIHQFLTSAQVCLDHHIFCHDIARLSICAADNDTDRQLGLAVYGIDRRLSALRA